MRAVALSLLCALAATARAQAPSRQTVPAVSFRYEKATRESGSAARSLIVHVEIAPGWHINSDAPLDEFLVPTTVAANADGWEFGKPRYPKPERVHSQVMGDMLLFSGAFDVELPARRKGSARDSAGSQNPSGSQGPPGSQEPPRTRVTLTYQACDHATCFPPKEVTVER